MIARMVALQTSFAIRRLEAHEWQTHREIRLRALADAPDAFGTTLAEAQARGADAWAARLSVTADSGRDFPLIAERDGAAVGLLWAMVDEADSTMVEVFQVWVDPESRGLGIAAALLREAIAWAKSKDARVVQLGVTCGDTPALRLYRRAGFQDVGLPEPLRPGSPLFGQTMTLMIAGR